MMAFNEITETGLRWRETLRVPEVPGPFDVEFDALDGESGSLDLRLALTREQLWQLQPAGIDAAVRWFLQYGGGLVTPRNALCFIEIDGSVGAWMRTEWLEQILAWEWLSADRKAPILMELLARHGREARP